MTLIYLRRFLEIGRPIAGAYGLTLIFGTMPKSLSSYQMHTHLEPYISKHKATIFFQLQHS